MIVFFALTSALVFGAADFCGGSATRRAAGLPVLLISVPAGILALVGVAVALGGEVKGAALAWGVAAGVAGALGLLVFYRALAKGPMSVVAPISGLLAALVPAVAGVARGERLSLAAIAGVLLCLVAIVFVSMEKSEPLRLTGGPVLAVLAGLSFGLFFVLIRFGGDEHSLWPLLVAKISGLGVVLVAALLRRGTFPFRMDRATVVIAVLAGVLDVTGNALYVFATRAGMLSIAGVLSSLYPASTVLLARLVYHERLRPIQRVGLAIAVAGVVLVTTG